MLALVRCESCGHDNPAEAHFCASCGSSLRVIAEQPSPAVTATSAVPATPEAGVEYIGFWIRFGVAVIDGIVIWLISSVLSYFLLSDIVGFRLAFLSSLFWFPLPWLYYWLFTGLKGQTLGKMAVGIRVVNAEGYRPGLGRAALREVLGKMISFIVLFLGFLWVIWDERKQGWHDKIANTYVVKVEKVGRSRRNYAVP